MRTSLSPFIALVLMAGSACQPRMDPSAAAESLLARDRAWAQAAQADASVDSIVEYWTSDARVLLPGQPALVGKDAIRQMVSASLATPGFHISWVPDSAVVSASGDLGYTYGTNSVTVPDSTGKSTAEAGRYITVWRKDTDGQWRCVFDIFNVGPAKVGA
jgi:ketosteroid isomerase-like protein